MRFENNLQRRVLLGMLVFASISGIVCAAVIYVAYEQVEQTILDSLVSLEQQELMRTLNQNHNAVLPQSATLHFYLRSRQAESPIPTAFANLSSGIHHDVLSNGGYYHVAVWNMGADRAFIAFDTTVIQHAEDRLITLVVMGATLTPLVAVAVGVWLARKIIAPVSSLAAQVTTLDPKKRNAPLAPSFRGYEVEAIAQAFDRYTERIDRLVEREQSFTAAASHELRSPLAIISTSAELLECDPRIPAPLRATVTRMRHAIRDMSDFISAMLFLAREPETSRPVVEAETAIHDLLPRMVHDYRSLTDRAIDLDLTANDRLTVSAPESHVGIIIGNLLRNAIGCTKTATITASLRDRRLMIVDTGCGIPARDLAHIFERHYKGANSQGHGLGLYIAKNICDRYGWRLEITSLPNEGTTALVEF